MTAASDGSAIVEPARLGATIRAWWLDLHPDEHGRGDRGPRARLRRCETPMEALVVPTTLQLIEALSDRGERRDDRAEAVAERIRRALDAARAGREPKDGILSAAACLAACLAQAEPPQDKSDRKTDFAARLGQKSDGERPKEGERPRLSRLRFARLMQTQDWTARQRELRRALKQLGETRFNVERFATDLLHWDDRVRRVWILAYHQQFRSDKEASR